MDLKVIGYIIILAILIFAFVGVNIYRDLTTNTTKELGFCNIPEDCEEQDLVHIQCVGRWVCEQNRCGWVCVTEVPTQQQGGLFGSTVECYEDSHCQLGTCPDGSNYKKYSCVSNKCTEINYFADPCMYK